MKVYIGPYINWVGPYQIAEKLLFWANKYEDDRVHAFGTWLATNKQGESSWLMKVCQWFHNKQKRKIKIKIHGYDLWSADETLNHVIHAVLVEFVKNIGGSPAVDKEDVPEELHSTYGEYSESDGGMSTFYSHEAWKYVLNEMIYAFDPDWDDKYGFGSDDYTPESYKKFYERKKNALRLFGKYYDGIWN